MSNALKALIAAACVAILAFVGYYFVGEYRHAARVAEAKRLARSAEIERQRPALCTAAELRLFKINLGTIVDDKAAAEREVARLCGSERPP